MRSDAGSGSETCLTSFVGENQVTVIQLKEGADTGEKRDPQSITFQTTRTETEVSFMLV